MIHTTKMRVEKFECSYEIYMIGDTWEYIFFKEARFIDSHELKGDIGELIGYVDIIYPFAGLELKMTLEIYKEIIDVELNIIDGVLKIPFAFDKTPMRDLYKYRDELENHMEYEELMESIYDKCSCGGYMRPMYDQFPNWITFCTVCDARHENFDVSPILEPLN